MNMHNINKSNKIRVLKHPLYTPNIVVLKFSYA